MFKKAIIIGVAILVVGCSANGVKEQAYVKASIDGLQNYNVAETQKLNMEGKELPFLSFHKKTETVVIENGQKFKDTLNSFGSGIQWNEDYVVTAKHVNFVENSAYQCQKGCDIQFVKRKANDTIPVWREVVSREKVTFVGIDESYNIQQKTGFELDRLVYTTSNSDVLVRLVSVSTLGGMSGGPAYAEDGSVVGILTGSTSENGSDMAVLVPYSIIQAEWNKFQSTQSQLVLNK